MITSYYFLGAGGIGMSALERYYNRQGLFVAGYDKTPTPLTETLESEGIAIHYDDNPELIPNECRDPHPSYLSTTNPRPHGPSSHATMSGASHISLSRT